MSKRIPTEYTESNILALTPLQQALVAGTLADSTAYVVQAVNKVEQSVDIERLREAWEAVAQEVDVLRLRVYMKGLMHPVQVVLEGPGPFIGWEYVDGRTHHLITDSDYLTTSDSQDSETESQDSVEELALVQQTAHAKQPRCFH